MTGSRPLEEIRRRGRWASVKSVQRYSKTHRLVAARARVPDGIMEQGRAFLEQPELAALVLRVLEGGALSCPVRTRSPPNLEKAGELSGKKVDELREILK